MTTLIDIDKLAEKVGMRRDGKYWYSAGGDDFDVTHEQLLKFAAAVVASISPQSSMSWQEGFEAGVFAEREACANVADLVAREIDDTNGTATYVARAIRARGHS